MLFRYRGAGAAAILLAGGVGAAALSIQVASRVFPGHINLIDARHYVHRSERTMTLSQLGGWDKIAQTWGGVPRQLIDNPRISLV